MSESIGIVTFTNKKYIDICEQLVNSVLYFTNLPITVFCVDCEMHVSSERVNLVNISNEHNDEKNWFNSLASKPYVCSQTPYDITFYLDSDIIVTKLFQAWVESNIEKISKLETLFCAAHPHKPSTNEAPTKYYINQFFNLFNVKEIPGYIFASAFAFNKKLIPHFENIYKKIDVLIKNNIFLPTGDECVMNLYFYKKNMMFDCGYDFMPNPTEGLFEAYIDGGLEKSSKYIKDYKNWGREVKPVLFHGNKNVEYAKLMIEQLAKK
jgi:hypothetical protein